MQNKLVASFNPNPPSRDTMIPALRTTLSVLTLKLQKNWAQFSLYMLFALMIGFGVDLFLPEQVDWVRTYRPATIALITGQSPYDASPYYSPPWTLFPLIPMALLPSKIGGALLFVLSAGLFVYMALRMKATKMSAIAFFLSFPVLFCLLFGQIDALVLLGFFLPAPVGLFLLLGKPQISLAGVLFFAYQAWRKGGLRELVRVFLPVTLAMGISILIYGPWFINHRFNFYDALYNMSLSPISIPVGLVILFFALRKNRQPLSMLSSPFFSPYVPPHSWSGALLSLLPYQWLSVGACLFSYVMLWIGFMRQ